MQQQEQFPEVEFPESGIYAILNTANDKVYVGSAVNLRRRWLKHIRFLNKQNHHNEHLQAAWYTYGQAAFIFTVLKYCNREKLSDNEKYYINELSSFDREYGYNILIDANNRLGVLHTDATKTKMSKAHKGRIKSSEWQDKINASITGKKRTLEQRKRMSEAQKGRKISDETRANMAKGQLGRKHSEESKLKRSIALKGKPFNNPKKNPKHSEETKLKQSIARKNYLKRINEGWTSTWL